MTEIFKDIEGYEGHYQVSNLGRVKSLGNNKSRREKILQPCKTNKFGHLAVNLWKNGETNRVLVHRLVGKAFVKGWFPGAVINHIDHKPENNLYTNLEWTTQKDNTSREKSFGAEKLSKKVYQFKKDGTFVKEWLSTIEVERQTGFDQGNICKCCNGKRKSAYNYRWRYA